MDKIEKMKVTELKETLNTMKVPFGRTAKKAELKALLLSVIDSNQGSFSIIEAIFLFIIYK